MSQVKRGKSVKRGEFLKIAALTVTALFIKACSRLGINLSTETTESGNVEIISTPTPEEQAQITDEQDETQEATENPTLPGDENMSKVAFIKTNDRVAGVQQAIDLLGINPVEGKHVFFKPNFNSADPAPGSSHPDVLRTMVLKLQEMGAAKITMGDRSGMGDTRRAMEQIGIFSLANELGFEVIVFDELGAEDWEMFTPTDSHWKKGFAFARPILDADVVVQACCLKTHKFGGHFTMSLKNSVGMIAKTIPGQKYNYMNELHTSLSQRKKIAEINSVYETGLIVMDGVEAFTKGGPATGTKVDSQVVLAATDRIAIDAVGVALLRYYGTTSQVSKGSVFEQAQIARAVDLGLGVDNPEKIEIITADTDSAAYAEEIKAVLLS
jgi:uncharacterized protein (DUF362 family)